jgi:hypothetical protein
VPQQHELVLVLEEYTAVLRQTDHRQRPASAAAAAAAAVVLELLGVHRPPRAIDRIVRKQPTHVPPQIDRQRRISRHVEPAVQVRVRDPHAREPQ